MLSDELVHVPTVAELVKQGHAKPHPQGGYTISAKGQELMTDAMRHNGLVFAKDSERREQARLAMVERANARKVEIDDHSGQGWQHKG